MQSLKDICPLTDSIAALNSRVPTAVPASNGVMLKYELGLKHDLEHEDSSPSTVVNNHGHT